MGRRSMKLPARRRVHLSEDFFHELEPRQLLATINILNFGATPNDSTDDRSAIVAAINASHDGDTIFFPTGTYNLSKEISTNSSDVHVPLGHGRIYKGETTFTTDNLGNLNMQDRSILVSTGTDVDNKKNAIFNFRETNPNPNTFNVKFTNLTFRGRGLNLATNVGAMVEGVIADNNHFDVAGGGNNNGVEFTTGLRNTQITNNIFHLGGSNGIYGYNWDHLTIANNWFLNPPSQPAGSEGIHVIAHSYSSPNLLIEQNYFSGVHRMGIEYQGGGVDTVVQDNWYENPNISSNSSQNADTFAYSIVADRSLRTITTHNVAIMPTNAQSPDGKGVRIVFELGGQDLYAHDNYTDGGNDVVAVNGSGSTGRVGPNKFKNFNHATGNNNGSTTNYSSANNGPNVTINFDPFASTRLRPQPNHRYGDATQPPPPPNVPAAPTALQGSAVSYSEIDLNWSDQATNETGYRVEQFNGSTWVTVVTLGVDSSSYAVTGLTPLTSYTFRVIAFNAFGDSNPTNTVTISTLNDQIPLAATNLVGTTVGLNQIDLTWTDNSDNETGFQVQRLAEDGVTWVVMASVNANVTGYSLTSLASGRNYSFRVIAFNNQGQANPSNIAAVQTPVADISTASAAPTARRSRIATFYAGGADTAVSPTVTGAS